MKLSGICPAQKFPGSGTRQLINSVSTLSSDLRFKIWQHGQALTMFRRSSSTGLGRRALHHLGIIWSMSEVFRDRASEGVGHRHTRPCCHIFTARGSRCIQSGCTTRDTKIRMPHDRNCSCRGHSMLLQPDAHPQAHISISSNPDSNYTRR